MMPAACLARAMVSKQHSMGAQYVSTAHAVNMHCTGCQLEGRLALMLKPAVPPLCRGVPSSAEQKQQLITQLMDWKTQRFNSMLK